MCSDVAIRVSNVSKTYKVTNDEERRKGGWRRLLRVGSQGEYVRALEDVSFEVKRGETLGIIGRNGAGKSTLLRVITGITQPDSGSIEVNGVVAPVLALQSGFNVQRTGRENIYLKGAAMGITRAEMDNRFDAIASFADIGEFIEQPLRTYSSGMRARLAFAVAFHTDPEILIVDETLTVGDELFRRKCFDRIASIKESGATTLFVTHGYHALVQFCNRALLMERGQRLLVGDPKAVVDRFQELVYAPPNEQAYVEDKITNFDRTGGLRTVSNHALETKRTDFSDGGDPTLEPETRREFVSRGAQIRSVRLVDGKKNALNVLTGRNTYSIDCQVTFSQPATKAKICVAIKTVEGFIITERCLHVSGVGRHSFVQAGQRVEGSFLFENILKDGTYLVDCRVFGELNDREILLHGITDALAFRVETGEASSGRGLVELLKLPDDVNRPAVVERRPDAETLAAEGNSVRRSQ